jgi:phage antirepressor YoqD-like protein
MPKKTTEKDKQDFLKLFGKRFYSIRKTCKEIGIGKSTFYRWMQDTKFNIKVNRIKTIQKGNRDKWNKILRDMRKIRRTSRLLRKHYRGEY